MPIAIVLVLVAAIVVQRFVRNHFGGHRPVGDESEYLERARSADPFGTRPFLRPPLMTVFVRLCGGHGDPPDLALALMSVALVTIGLVMIAGGIAFGPAGALSCGLLYLLVPDRIVLSQRIWPDTLLALVHAALLVLLVAEPGASSLVQVAGLGVLTACAALVRIDAIVLLPALTLHPLLRDAAPLAAGLVALWAPTLLALGWLSIFNARRYGIPLPDTTVLFNLSVLGTELRTPGAPVIELVDTANARWTHETQGERVAAARSTALAAARRPWFLLLGAVRRTLQMLGPDTFGAERLRDPRASGGSEPHPALRRTLEVALRFAFPLLVALLLTGLVAGPYPSGAYLLPMLAAFIASCVVHARTRYRYALLPTLSFGAVNGLAALYLNGSWETWAAFSASFLLLLAAPARRERRP